MRMIFAKIFGYWSKLAHFRAQKGQFSKKSLTLVTRPFVMYQLSG